MNSTSKSLLHPVPKKFKLFKLFKLFKPFKLFKFFDLHRLMESHATGFPFSCLRRAGYPPGGGLGLRVVYPVESRPDAAMKDCRMAQTVIADDALITDEYTVELDALGRVRISPTDVSQFIRLDQCERYLRLRLLGPGSFRAPGFA
jgi:hypothetical protein